MESVKGPAYLRAAGHAASPSSKGLPLLAPQSATRSNLFAQKASRHLDRRAAGDAANQLSPTRSTAGISTTPQKQALGVLGRIWTDADY